MDKIDAFLRSPVRPLVTLMFGVTFCWLTYVKIIPVEAFIATATMVLQWWFRARDDKENGGTPTRR